MALPVKHTATWRTCALLSGMALLLGIASVRLSAQEGRFSVTLLDAGMIYEQSPFPSCHASTVVCLDDGLLAAWFGGTREGNPDVCIYASRKTEGNAWSTPQLIADGIQDAGVRYPCWNPVLFKRDNGDIILYYKVGPSPRKWWGEYKISKDEGCTWSEKREIPRSCLGPVKNKPVRLPSGMILYPTSIEVVGKWNVYMETSGQDLSGWEKIEIDNNGFDAIQPSVLHYEDGSLQILCRSRNKRIVESWSRDNGKTWSKLSATSLPNNNAGTDAVTLSNGLQLLVYNPITEGRNRLAIAVSIDGKAWEKLMDLENQQAGEFSYPAVIEDKNGIVHVTYTYNREQIKHVMLQITDITDITK
ncbi:MAG: exo-alpha-sialidase [Tannerellaceae bacterium]|nr:exo-alpha-sialidase [Tannerellaceae bacterium]